MCHAPGEAPTPDFQISLSVLTYKYDALTDCATIADTVPKKIHHLSFSCVTFHIYPSKIVQN